MRWISSLLLTVVVVASGLSQNRGPVYHNYQQGVAESLRTGKPLLVFVGHVPRFSDPAYVHAIAQHLEGYPYRCVVVATPVGGDLLWKQTLPETAKEVRPVQAAPFRFVFAVQSTLDCTSGG